MTTPGSTTARGYGNSHQRERARWEPVVAAGEAFCSETICVMPARWIKPGTQWHLAHTPDRTGWLGPAHARCNLAERNRRVNGSRRKSGSRSRAIRKPGPKTLPWRTSRQW
jgi:hypothetical protein